MAHRLDLLLLPAKQGNDGVLLKDEGPVVLCDISETRIIIVVVVITSCLRKRGRKATVRKVRTKYALHFD